MREGPFGEPRLLSETEIAALLWVCEDTRYAIRNRAIILLATDAGLTPLEMSGLKRFNVLTDDGLLGDYIDLLGKRGKYLTARKIPMARDGRLWNALLELLKNAPALPRDPLIISERARLGGRATSDPGASKLEPMRATSIGFVFWRLAERAGIIGLDGARAARRTFITRAGRRMRDCGATIRDVQIMSGQRSLESTQRLIEADDAAQRRLIGDLFDPLRH